MAGLGRGAKCCYAVLSMLAQFVLKINDLLKPFCYSLYPHWKTQRTNIFWKIYCSPMVMSEESLLTQFEVQDNELQKEQQDSLNELESFILATGSSRHSLWCPLYPKRKTERTDMFWETYR